MNITQYVKSFGNKEFKELPFNEIDSLILSELSYINFDLEIKSTDFIQIKDLKIKDSKAFYYGSVDAKNNKKLLEAMMKSKRYQNVKIGYCKLLNNHESRKQFFAMTLLLPNHVAYIAYRGTDTSLLGWKESLSLVYEEAMPSKDLAVEYIRTATTLFKGKFYVGGHSKGGYLAMCAVLFMGEKLEERLIKAYTFDGPGLREDVEKLDSFNRIKDKLEKYLTTHDVIGVVYNHASNAKIVYSTGVLLGGHDPFKWMVNYRNMTFSYTRARSYSSRRSEEAMMNWLTNESDEDKRLAIEVLFDVLGDSKTIYDLLLNASRIISNGKKKFKSYTVKRREKTKEIFKSLGRYYLNAYSPKRFLMKNKNEVKQIEKKTENQS